MAIIPCIDLKTTSEIFESEDTALHIMQEFLVELSDQIPLLKSYHHDNRWHDLRELCHKLHGAACYASTPKLKALLSHIEQTLIQSHEALCCQEPKAAAIILAQIQDIHLCLEQTSLEAKDHHKV